ncbi:MAG: oxidoreductase, partial [Gemmatimonadota bacterium]
MPTNDTTLPIDAPQPDDAAHSAFLERVRAATELLETIIADRTLMVRVPADARRRLIQAAGHVYAPDATARRQFVRATARQRKADQTTREERVRERTGIRMLRRQTEFSSPNIFPPTALESGDADAPPDVGEVPEPQHCYVCKQDYTAIHHFYDQLCPACARFNFFKRGELADLRGRVALLTGGRVKIGYQAGIKLLRSGAHLIVTTRFPRDSASRYAREPDFAEWGHRLEIFGLDLRHTPSVEAFCSE